MLHQVVKSVEIVLADGMRMSMGYNGMGYTLTTLPEPIPAMLDAANRAGYEVVVIVEERQTVRWLDRGQ